MAYTTPRKFNSKFDGNCHECNANFSQGTPILYMNRKIVGCPSCNEDLAKEAKVSREVELTFEVKKLAHQSTGFTILVGKARDVDPADFPDASVDVTSEFSVKGDFPAFSAGDIVEVRGKWSWDNRFGWGLRADIVTPVMNRNDAAAVETVLRQIRGIDVKKSAAIIKHFGAAEVFGVLDDAPERLLEVDGIGVGLMEQIKTSWEDLKGIRDALKFSAELGLHAGQRRGVIDEWGAKTPAVVRSNPYVLMQISGIGFETADAIALKHFRLDADDPRRLGAAVAYLIREEEEGWGGGHTTTVVGL